MKKEEKTQVINQLVETLNANTKIYLADCSSLTVEKVNQLRKACFDKKVTIKVVKNTLLKKALEQASDSRLAELVPALKGNTVLMTAEVANAPAKVIKDFRKKGNDKPLLKGAFVEEGIYLGDNQLDTLAAMKSKNELIGEVIGLLQSPIQRVISGLENRKDNTEAAA
jgi:large subunit ribosomal protein L10